MLKFDNIVNQVGTQVAEQLSSLLVTKFRHIPENEATAALLAASDVLSSVDLTDELFFAADADPEELARLVRRQCSAPVGLSSDATPLYDMALDQSCRHLVEVVRFLPSFQPRALAESLSRLTLQSAQLTELLARVPVTSLQAPHGTDRDTEFTAAYLRQIASTLDKVVLLALGRHEQPKLSLTTAYLSLSVSERLTRRSRSVKHHADDKWFADPDRTTTVRAEAAIGSAPQPWVLVLGEAGSGKTTLLDWLAVTAAQSGFTDRLASWNSCVPFPIRLREFSKQKPPVPEEFVKHSWPMNADRMPLGWAHRHLEAGTALVLVDGVDEVPAHRRPQVRDWLGDLVTQFPKAKVVVTTRPAALASQKWLGDEGFTDVSLLPMSAEDIRSFVARWHEAAELSPSLPCDHSELPAAKQRLLDQFAHRPYLRPLAENPLLCAMLCALNLDHAAELPKNRMELYRRALAMLLDVRDAKRGIPALLDIDQQYRLLGDIAWRLTEGGLIETTEADALDYIELKLQSMPNVAEQPKDILKHLLVRTGVVRRPIPGKVDFVHRTFQEYLAASEATEQGRIPALVANAHLDTWRETIVMACGHAKRKQVDDLMTRILDRADKEPAKARKLRLLAAACLETINELDPDVHTRLDTMIRTRLIPPRNVRETKSIGEIGHRVLGYLPSTVEDLSESAAAATVRVAGQTGNVEALRYLTSYAQDPRHEVQRELVEAWEFFEPQRYAEEVLADAPLIDGNITITAVRFLPHVRALRNLGGLDVDLSANEAGSELSFLDGLPCLTRLSLDFGGGVVDVSPVAGHAGLNRLGLYFANRYTRLSALQRLSNLTSLTLFLGKSWPDIKFLRGAPSLTYLGLNSLRRVQDYSPLDDLPDLSTFALWECDGISMWTGNPWPQVKHLFIRECTGNGLVEQVSELFPGVETLVLARVPASSLVPLAGLPLTDLTIESCPITDLSPITDLASLAELTLGENLGDVDLEPLAGRTMRLRLDRESVYRGLDRLGPGVTVQWIG